MDLISFCTAIAIKSGPNLNSFGWCLIPVPSVGYEREEKTIWRYKLVIRVIHSIVTSILHCPYVDLPHRSHRENTASSSFTLPRNAMMCFLCVGNDDDSIWVVLCQLLKQTLPLWCFHRMFATYHGHDTSGQVQLSECKSCDLLSFFHYGSCSGTVWSWSRDALYSRSLLVAAVLSDVSHR